MSDLIRRSDAIEAIANLHILADEEKIFRVYADNPHSMTTDFEGTLIDAINAIKSISSTDRPQGEWIPCKRRLPEEGVVVLVCMGIKGHKFDWEEQRCIEFGRISSDRYDIDGTGWEWLNESGADFWEPDWNDNILAWMPLPEPWKGADDE